MRGPATWRSRWNLFALRLCLPPHHIEWTLFVPLVDRTGFLNNIYFLKLKKGFKLLAFLLERDCFLIGDSPQLRVLLQLVGPAFVVR